MIIIIIYVDNNNNICENKEEKECELICDKIKYIINNKFKINKNNKKVDANLSDICVMCRNFNKYSKILFEKFKNNNINFKTSDANDFLNSCEIEFLINMLQVLDNKYSEIILINIMLHDFFGFKIEEILKIKQKYNNLNLYNSVKKYCNINNNNNILKKCIFFIKYLDKFKEKNLCEIIINLIYDLENKFGKNIYYDKFLQILNLFINNNNIINIENFIDYILNNKNFNFLEDFEYKNAVLITSIHKAKGKEFPICFLLGGSPKNSDNNIIFDLNLGVALKTKTKNNLCESSNIFRDIIEIHKKYKEKSEELRILYVAFTRAKEKLFIISD